ncbi:hypothetical protein LXL04_005768 [Taraxacum kok-saghyz]
MESACVYDETTVIHELTQGIKMAEQLTLNLNSPETREFLIKNILSSYDKALFILKSGGHPRASPLPESSPPKSPISTSSHQSTDFEFDENGFSKKRKASTTWEDEVRILPDNKFEESTPDEIISKLKATLSFKAWDLDTTLSPSFSPHSTQFEFSDDAFHPLNFPNHFDENAMEKIVIFTTPHSSHSYSFLDDSKVPRCHLLTAYCPPASLPSTEVCPQTASPANASDAISTVTLCFRN